MNQLGWLQAEKQMRLHYLYQELTGNTVEGGEMLTEYIRLLAEVSMDIEIELLGELSNNG